MDVRYITPKLRLGAWTFEIPESQRSPEITAEADIWIWVPEGIHTIQVVWKGTKGASLRYKDTSEPGVGRVLFALPTGPDSKPVMDTLVVPPGGGRLTIPTSNQVVASDLEAGKITHCGLTLFLGTNEPTA